VRLSAFLLFMSLCRQCCGFGLLRDESSSISLLESLLNSRASAIQRCVVMLCPPASLFNRFRLSPGGQIDVLRLFVNPVIW